MTERTPKETVTQAIEDFDSIKSAIIGHKIDVPYATKTSEYASLIAKIRVGSITGSVYTGLQCANTRTIIGAVQCGLNGYRLNSIIGNAVSAEDYD